MSIQDTLIGLESIINRSDPQLFFKLSQCERGPRAKLYSHLTSRSEVEVIVGKEAVMICNRKINSLCKLIAREFDLKAAAYTHHLRIDGRFGKRQVFERGKEVVVAGNDLSVSEQLTVDDSILSVYTFQQLGDPKIEIRATCKGRDIHISNETLQDRSVQIHQ